MLNYLLCVLGSAWLLWCTCAGHGSVFCNFPSATMWFPPINLMSLGLMATSFTGSALSQIPYSHSTITTFKCTYAVLVSSHNDYYFSFFAKPHWKETITRLNKKKVRMLKLNPAAFISILFVGLHFPLFYFPESSISLLSPCLRLSCEGTPHIYTAMPALNHGVKLLGCSI